jgi:predicted nucleic acid-binding Zn ribbon protein
MRDEHPEMFCGYCSEPMVRSFLPTNVHYRGDGFYSTDHVLSEPEEEDVLNYEAEHGHL